jgi:hygromycin-B 7''-O-kinase
MPGVMTVPPPPVFADDDAYETSLKRAAFWAPYARAALRAAGLPDEGEVVTHFPTTHVAASVGGAYLVKLHYEDRFGEDCFQTEREAYGMLTGRRLPIPKLLAEGALYREEDGWRWPFLVMTAMPGRAMRDVDGSLTPKEREHAADFVGKTLRKLHGTPVHEGEYLSLELYVDLIQTRTQRCHRDHEQWGSLPSHLVDQVRDYVWDAHKLIDPEEGPHELIHGDLHGGNVFLDGEPAAMKPTGIVDFNDVYVGDRHYDLVAIHLKGFGADKRLLGRVLEAYGWGELGRHWPQRMLAFTLAHDFDMIRPVVERYPEAVKNTATLGDLATLLWDLDAPGPA